MDYEDILEEFEELVEQYIMETDPEEKVRLKEKLDELETYLI